MSTLGLLCLIFYSVEGVIGIINGYLLYLHKCVPEEKHPERNNMISNLLLILIFIVAGVGCALFQIYENSWWAVFPLFLTGLLLVYITYGIIKGIKEAGVKKRA